MDAESLLAWFVFAANAGLVAFLGLVVDLVVESSALAAISEFNN